MGCIKINGCMTLAPVCERTRLPEGAGEGGGGHSRDCARPHAKPWPGSLGEAHLREGGGEALLPHFCQLQPLFATGPVVPVCACRQGGGMAGNLSASGS